MLFMVIERFKRGAGRLANDSEIAGGGYLSASYTTRVGSIQRASAAFKSWKRRIAKH